MKDKLATILNIMLIVLLGISVVFGVIFYIGTSMYGAEAEFSEQIEILGWRLTAFMNWAFVLVIIGAAASFLFPVVQMFTNPASSKKSLLSVVMIGLVVLLGYSIASPEILEFPGYEKFFYEDNTMDPNTFSKYVGTGLWSMYIFGGIAVVAILWAEISKVFK